MELIEKIPRSKKDLWKCDCGNIKEIRSDAIKAGKTKSCGCGIHTVRSTVPSEIRRTFTLMKYRCNNENSPDYTNYGGRGIKVLYNNYDEFYKDVGDKPSNTHTIDRIDVNKNYEIGNCEWATSKEQMNNIRRNRVVEYSGNKYTVAQLSEKFEMGYTTLRDRLDRGMTVEDAVNTPIDMAKSHKRKRK